MKKILTLAGVLCSFFSLSAFAGQTLIIQHAGKFYEELNIGTNLYYVGIVSSQENVSGADIIGIGWSGAIGYSFSNTFGVEGGFMQNYVTADFDNNQTSHINVPYVSTRFTVPLFDRFSFIGKIGAMYPNVGMDGLLIPYTGVGLSYAATEKLDTTIQYQGGVYGIAGAGLLSLGITYHF